MTSGLPPDAAVFGRAGDLVPPAVASVVSLPVALVFVGTVLLSVALRWCCGGPARRCVLVVGARCGSHGTGARPRPSAPAGAAAENAPRRATVSHSRDKASRTTLRGRAVRGPTATAEPRPRALAGRPATRSVGDPDPRHDRADRRQGGEVGVVVVGVPHHPVDGQRAGAEAARV